MRIRRLARSLAFPVLALMVAGLLRFPTTVVAQGDGFDPEDLALTFHRVTGEILDTRTLATRSQAATSAGSFDRPEVIAAETKRLDARLASASPGREFTITIDDRITDYDHTAGQFSVELFTPGYYIPVQAFGRQYQVVFANAASVRAIAMAREQARELDMRLAATGRRVNNEIHFKVIGKGDPAGAVSGPLVVRAEVTAVRLLDQAGQVLYTPQATPVGAGPRFAGFDAAKTDVAGLRVGMSRRDMEATLTRLFGKVTPGSMSGGFKGFASVIEVNSMGCMSMMGRRTRPQPGDVCVTAYLDAGDVVRMVRVQRLFPPNFDGEVFRRAMVQKYGPASGAQRAGISWGPGVPGAVLNNPTITVDALTATVAADSDVMSTMGNRLENIVVTLQLIDAAWAATVAK